LTFNIIIIGQHRAPLSRYHEGVLYKYLIKLHYKKNQVQTPSNSDRLPLHSLDRDLALLCHQFMPWAEDPCPTEDTNY